MNHTDYQQLLAAYALEAIDPSDGRALGEHLVGCPECRAELSDLREAAGLLAHGAPPQTPSPSVRDRPAPRMIEPIASGAARGGRRLTCYFYSTTVRAVAGLVLKGALP